MWKKGEEYVLKTREENFLYRFLWNLFGSVILLCAASCALARFPFQLPNDGLDWKSIFAYLFLLALGVFIIYNSYKEPNKSEWIVIGKDGLAVNGILHRWDEIDYVYVDVEQKQRVSAGVALSSAAIDILLKKKGLKKKTHTCLHVLSMKEGQAPIHKQYRMDGNYFFYKESDINEAIDYWSGSKVGGKEALERQQYIDKLSLRPDVTSEDAVASREKMDAHLPLLRKVWFSVLPYTCAALFIAIVATVWLYFCCLPPAWLAYMAEKELVAIYFSIPSAIFAGTTHWLVRGIKFERCRTIPEMADLNQREFDDCVKLVSKKGDEYVALALMALMALYCIACISTTIVNHCFS